MWPYWILFVLSSLKASAALQQNSLKLHVERSTNWPAWWWLTFTLLVLIVGLRHEVGTDWYNYLAILESVTDIPLKEALFQSDPAYSLLNWTAAKINLGIYFVNFVCAALFSWGLIEFCRNQPRQWLALTVAVPYLITVVSMGYSRQGVAIGLAMLGLVALSKAHVFKFVIWVAAAATFHKSALILLPLAMLADSKRKSSTLLLIGITGSLLFVLLLQESIESLSKIYIEAELESSGAAIRVAMNALPALVFLVFRRRFKMTTPLLSFWTWMACGALFFIIVLQASPSSTAIDRIALYWIPLQIVVWSRLPEALGRGALSKVVLNQTVIVYSAAVLLVWLVFATHAESWLPYQFYPFN